MAAQSTSSSAAAISASASQTKSVESLFRMVYRKDVKSSERSRYAYVLSVFKNSDYMLGALVCAHSLRLTGTANDIVCLITSDISAEMIELAKTIFTIIYEVPYLTLESIPLRTEKQRELYGSWKDISCTKWNCLGLVEYEKIIFIDADKVVIQNIDQLFALNTPAGTFSVPKAEGYVDRGIANPYRNLCHGDKIDSFMIDYGLNGIQKYGQNRLQSSFVVIGTSIVLSPSIDHYSEFVGMLGEFTSSKPFGYSLCNSGMDEQALVHFYHVYLPTRHKRKFPWTYVSQKFNWIQWNKTWLRSGEFPPAVVHYFGKKPWFLKRHEWHDLDLWWDFVEHMIKSFPDKKQAEQLVDLYRPDQLALKLIDGCWYCKLYDRDWTAHQFSSDTKIICPMFSNQLKK